MQSITLEQLKEALELASEPLPEDIRDRLGADCSAALDATMAADFSAATEAHYYRIRAAKERERLGFLLTLAVREVANLRYTERRLAKLTREPLSETAASIVSICRPAVSR